MFLKEESRRPEQLLPVILLIILLLGLISPFTGKVEGEKIETRAPGDGNYDDPEITVSLDEEIFFTEANPYPDNNAQVTGTILCVIPSYVPATVWVKLTISLIGVDINYDGSKEVYATKDEPHVDFLMSVYPKYQARAGETFNFEVEVLWSYSTPNGGAGVADPVYGQIEISPYGYIFMETIYQSPTMDIVIGETFNVKFDLYNNGNSNCLVELAIVETPSFTKVILVPTEVNIVSFGQEVIEATILQEAGEEQEGTFRIRVLSDIPGAPTMDEFTFAIRSHKEEEKFEFDISIIIVSSFVLIFAVIMVGFLVYVLRTNKAKKKRELYRGEDYYT